MNTACIGLALAKCSRAQSDTQLGANDDHHEQRRPKTMTDFETQVKAAAEKAVLHHVSSGQWLLPNYESRLKVPAEWMTEMWRLVDADRVRRQVVERIEAELAERMVNHMAAELATDIKQILSVKERREALRALAREHMDAVMKAGA